MKCVHCEERPATLTLTIQTNFERKQLSLCIGCYNLVKSSYEETPPFSDRFDDIFSNHLTSFGTGNAAVKPVQKTKKKGLLETLSSDLNELARAGKIDPLIGRHEEVAQVVETLNRRTKNNPVLIGEPGVGKTAIAEGLAMRIVSGDIPAKLADKKVYSLDVSTLVAGTGVRGQLEEKVKKLFGELESRNDVILFIDEIHLLVGAGSSEGSLDVGNIIKPSLARGRVQLMGATTTKEYRYIRKDAALERRFQPVIVNEPSKEDAFLILKGLQTNYETFHNVSYSDDVLKACIELADRYIQDRQLPDKAIDLMDIAGSRNSLKPSMMHDDSTSLEEQLNRHQKEKEMATANEKYELAAEYRHQELQVLKKMAERQEVQQMVPVNVEDIQAIVEKMTGIPIQALQSEDQLKMKNLKSNLQAQVIGQEEAVDKVAKAIRRSRAGLKPKNRPLASFLFVGPTGVGKTELSKALAKELFGNKEAMIRLDMSEYIEKHSTAKLIGSPPGYVGYEEAGQLTEKVRKNPYSIILLDEIEKAHPDVHNILLQVLEDGHLTDSQGLRVNFKETVIIATSNAATAQKERPKLGFNAETQSETFLMDELKHVFKPELLNRFDNIVAYRSLDETSLVKIVDLLLVDLAQSMQEKEISLNVSDEAKQHLARIGHDPSLGARPLRRAIQEHLEDPITDILLDGKSLNQIDVAVINGKMSYSVV